MPDIRSPQSFNEVVAQGSAFDLAFITDTTASTPNLSLAISDAPANTRILTLVGPEGGWTEEERNLADDAGFSQISLAPTILRTETASVAVCAAIAMHGTPATR